MILFLDFDGTTHPGINTDFRCLPRIEKVLREFPHVQVVISSWWRASHALPELRKYFSEDIRHRVIDVTPLEKVQAYGNDSPFLVSAKERGQEILEWISINNYAGPWVALDDDKRGFAEDCEQLIRCDFDVGVDAEIEEKLRHAFAAG